MEARSYDEMRYNGKNMFNILHAFLNTQSNMINCLQVPVTWKRKVNLGERGPGEQTCPWGCRTHNGKETRKLCLWLLSPRFQSI